MGNYNLLDLFCGTGAFSEGFKQQDDRIAIVGGIDVNHDALKTMKANHSTAKIFAQDITTLKPSFIKNELGVNKIDLIIGGPPCQGFTSLRPFRSAEKDDPRNSLFEQFALFVNYFRPKYFVLENVVGLLTHESGRTLLAIENCFESIGYDFEWHVLNAANYGVPQKRERFIMIGTERGGTINFPNPTHSYNGRSIGYKDRTKMIFGHDYLPRALTIDDAISDLPDLEPGEVKTHYKSEAKNSYQKARRKNSTTVSLHIAAKHSEKLLEIMKHAGESINSIPSHLITSGFSSSYSRLDPNSPSTTLTVKFNSAASSKCIHPYENRAITPREGARIQSFDDDYSFQGSKTSIISQIGNAVPPQLSSSIAHEIIKQL